MILCVSCLALGFALRKVGPIIKESFSTGFVSQSNLRLGAAIS